MHRDRPGPPAADRRRGPSLNGGARLGGTVCGVIAPQSSFGQGLQVVQYYVSSSHGHAEHASIHNVDTASHPMLEAAVHFGPKCVTLETTQRALDLIYGELRKNRTKSFKFTNWGLELNAMKFDTRVTKTSEEAPATNLARTSQKLGMISRISVANIHKDHTTVYNLQLRLNDTAWPEEGGCTSN